MTYLAFKLMQLQAVTTLSRLRENEWIDGDFVVDLKQVPAPVLNALG